MHGNLAGEVEIGGDLLGMFYVGNQVWGGGSDPALVVHGDVAGQVVVQNILWRKVQIDGWVLATGQQPGISVGWLSGQIRVEHDVARNIEIREDVHGSLDVPAVDVGGDLAAEIRIYKSLLDNAQSDVQIWVRGALTEELGGIAVDCDGVGDTQQDPQYWQTGAYVRVGTDPYVDRDANTPAEYLWEVSSCHGDANNDWAFNNFDITPFVLALSDESGYRSTYPGLSASMVEEPHLHGDLNCNGALNNFDITPFVMKLTDPDLYRETYPDCVDDCTGGDALQGGGSFDAETVAALLAEHLDADLMPFLISAAEDIIASSSDDFEAAFWAEVLAELE